VEVGATLLPRGVDRGGERDASARERSLRRLEKVDGGAVASSTSRGPNESSQAPPLGRNAGVVDSPQPVYVRAAGNPLSNRSGKAWPRAEYPPS
jgi:hypothetical protein